MNTLLVIDVQNDFCVGGALAVNDGDAIVSLVNRHRDDFELVVFSQDWHPEGHKSFASSHPGKQPGDHVTIDGVDQILWPDHCVQETFGAQFHPDLDVLEDDPIFQKGTDPEIDSYSAFFDNARKKSTGLSKFLKEKGVTELTICGLATDYCVKFSALDALSEGFKVNIWSAACRGVDKTRGDSKRALKELQEAGAKLISLD